MPEELELVIAELSALLTDLQERLPGVLDLAAAAQRATHELGSLPDSGALSRLRSELDVLQFAVHEAAERQLMVGPQSTLERFERAMRRFEYVCLMSRTEERRDADSNAAQADLLVVWDPELVDEGEYCELLAAFGDLVRAHGGRGVERLRSRGYGVPVGEGVPA